MTTRISVLILAAGCAGELQIHPEQLPPPALALEASLAFPGEPVRLVARGASPGDVLSLGRGDGRGSGPCLAPGVCIRLSSPSLVGTETADASGTATWDLLLEDNLSLGADLSFQVVRSGAAPAVSGVVERTARGDLWTFGVWRLPGGGVLEADNQRLRDPRGSFEVVWARGRTVIVRNGADTGPLAGGYGRIDRGVVAGVPSLCWQVEDASTAYEAWLSPSADAADPVAGCASGAWIALEAEPLVVQGTWTDNFGTTHVIDEQTWFQEVPGVFESSWEILRYSALDEVLIARNDPANPFAGGLYSRFDLTSQGGVLYYCQTAYAAPTEWDARVTPPADASDLSAGCAGFSWSSLLP